MLTLVVAFVLGALVAGGLVFMTTRPDSTTRRVEELRAEAAQRDRTQIAALTELARDTRDKLMPVMEGLNRVMPVDGTAGPSLSTPADVESWRKAAAEAVAAFADPPSGETATNVARASLDSAVRQIAATVDTYAAAQTLTGSDRTTLLTLAARQRAAAVFTWSIGATALDGVNVDAGYGHQHVFLSTSPVDGALTPDSEPEGNHHP